MVIPYSSMPPVAGLGGGASVAASLALAGRRGRWGPGPKWRGSEAGAGRAAPVSGVPAVPPFTASIAAGASGLTF
ncbi:hypothetical protein AB4Y38_41815 [Paraburkholderia sp. EG285A]|uniref:hypothetical protein n=1 Tax=Paraburkholderia sp. EG285A TaxID=3237009 RepID=UPI0034D26414